MTSPNRGAARPRAVIVTVALLLAAPACTTAGPAEADRPSLMEMARALGSDVMRTIVRGYVPGRSGEIVLVPEPWNVLGQWNGGLRGADDPRTSHSTPWSYHQRVPISLYGPGYIRPEVRSARPVDVADMAPTFAELMGFPFESEDGRPLREALVPRSRRGEPPRAIVVVVTDGGGWNVLQQWPDAWPAQRRLMEAGATYTNATVGSAPTVTAPIHATIGTGSYPRTHGIAENTGRLPNGTIGNITFGRGDLRLMREETLADAWDRSTGERAWVGMFGYANWHLTMMGQGALSGGDRDVAVLWDSDDARFSTNPQLYELPTYLPHRRVLDERIRELDAGDGELDGRWNGNTLDELSYLFTANPAFAEYQGEAIEAMAGREPIGRDAVTDLLFVELKTGDVAGHIWNMVNPEVEAVLQAQDRILDRLVDILDRKLGSGRYVLAMTADHGQSPLPQTKGGLRIDRFALLDDLNAEFGSVVETVHPSELFVEEGTDPAALEEIARFIGGYRFADGMPEGLALDDVPTERLDERVFAAALPGTFLQSLSEADIDALGPGAYPEGELEAGTIRF